MERILAVDSSLFPLASFCRSGWSQILILGINKSFQAAIMVAVLNIKIPILLGDLINVIANFIKDKSLIQISKLNPIAGRLLALYVVQVKISKNYFSGSFLQAVFTFFYITCLSIMGERMAANLRTQLFGNLLHQDMAFYDSQKTGEICDRLSFDVQEFKSSFKMCISQGLRTFAQVIVNIRINGNRGEFRRAAALFLCI